MIAAESTETVRDRVRDAMSREVSLRVSGRGTWMDAGRPVRATEIVSTRELTGILEYVPGDLTLTARAGTTLDEIRAATAEHNQWLALDPYGLDEGTIGATTSTASYGPLATSFGTPRDLVLGLEFVTGRGIVARGGGRVVKNVAGFDLTRLLTGAWGSLGVITEVTVRLHARPQVDTTVAVTLNDPANAAAQVRRLLRRTAFTPYACEVLDTGVTLFRLGGNRESVTAQRAALSELGTVEEADVAVWAKLRTNEPPGALVFRFSRQAAEIERTWTDAARVLSSCEGAWMHASPMRGVVRCIVPHSPENAAALAKALRAARDLPNRIGERLTPQIWEVFTVHAAGDELSARVKSAFDPRHILNPGIFGAGT